MRTGAQEFLMRASRNAACWIAALFLSGGLVPVSGAQQAAPPSAAPAQGSRLERAAVKQFVNQYCTQCHNNEDKTGGLTLEGISSEEIGGHPETWEKVARKLSARQMPPPGRKRPDERTYASFVGAL